VVIVNTCAFIEPAIEEAVDALLELSELKARGTLKALIATGCLPQRYGEALESELPEVDAFVGIGDTQAVLDAIQSALGGKRRTVVAAPRPQLDYSAPRWRTGAEWLAYIKIADGCDHQCAFCTIPSIRGEYRSGSPDGIVNEFRRLVESGVREVCLIAQDTTNYGADLALLAPERHLTPPPSSPQAERGENGGCSPLSTCGEGPGVRCRSGSGEGGGGARSLASLLLRLGEVDYDGWIRIQYMHPAHITDELLEAMRAVPAVVPYFDIPLQHVSREVLRRMGRAGDEGQYLALVKRIRKAIPEAAIRTTFIVGFPGETDDDFAALLRFIKAAKLDRVSAFRYWPEDGTRAAALPDHVPIEDADERLDALLLEQESISLSVNKGFVTRRLRVLIEKELRKGKLWSGRSYRDAPEVDGEVKIEGEGLEPGTFAEVEVTGAEVHDLKGRVAQ
jgi:ribosomal protein S12 methylthiotransferase